MHAAIRPATTCTPCRRRSAAIVRAASRSSVRASRAVPGKIELGDFIRSEEDAAIIDLACWHRWDETEVMMHKILNALLILAIVPGICHAQEKPKSPRRPNILWIVAENIDLDLGCYGAKHVHTPNLDALARSGVRFTRVFATSPVYAPSRSAFMTGMYQTTTDTHNMRSHRDDDFRLPPGVRPLTHWLQDAGYSTFNIGTILRWLVGTGSCRC